MSSPSDPVEMASTSTGLSFLPSRMMEPLPKFRSIWLRAASRAFCLSMIVRFPSITRNGVSFMNRCPLLFHRDHGLANDTECTRFVLVCKRKDATSLHYKPMVAPALCFCSRSCGFHSLGELFQREGLREEDEVLVGAQVLTE